MEPKGIAKLDEGSITLQLPQTCLQNKTVQKPNTIFHTLCFLLKLEHLRKVVSFGFMHVILIALLSEGVYFHKETFGSKWNFPRAN